MNNARRFPFIDYVKICVFGFGLSGLLAGLHGIIMPVLVLNFVNQSYKDTYLGLVTSAGLVLAMAVQPVVGLISDQSGSRLGRRRPFIIVGTVVAIPLIFGMGFVGSYAAFFVVYCLLQVSTNTAQSPWQGLLPDLVPKERVGLASGVKGFFEILGRVGLVLAITPLMARYTAGGTTFWVQLSLGILAMGMLVGLLVTILTVREQPASGGLWLPRISAIFESFKIDVHSQTAFVPFLVSRLLFLMPLELITTFGLYLLRDFVGVANPVQSISNFIVVASAAMLAAVYPAGRLSDKVGRRSITIASSFIGAAGILLLLFLHSPNYVLASAAVLGISYGTFLGANWAMAVDMIVKGQEARYLGLANVATAGAAAIAPLIGPVIDIFNTRSVGLGYGVMLMVCLALYLSSAGILLRLRTG